MAGNDQDTSLMTSRPSAMGDDDTPDHLDLVTDESKLKDSGINTNTGRQRSVTPLAPSMYTNTDEVAGALPTAPSKQETKLLPLADQMNNLAKMQKGYQDLDSLLDAQKGQLAQVPWFQLAAAFLNPGRTGSFGEALGGASAQLSDWKNKQIAATIPIAQQKLAIAQQQGAIAKQMMDLQGMQDYQKRTLGKDEVKVGEQDPAMSTASIQNMLLTKQKELVAASGNEPLQKMIMAEIGTLKQNLDIHKEAHNEYTSARDYALKLYNAGIDASKLKLELQKANFSGEISNKIVNQLYPDQLPSAAPFAGSTAPSAPAAAPTPTAAAPAPTPAASVSRAPVAPTAAPTTPAAAPTVAPAAAPSGGGAGLSGKQLMEQKGANVKQAEEEAKKKLESVVGFDAMSNANSTANLNYIRSVLSNPAKQKLVGILQESGYLSALANGMQEGIHTPFGSFSAPIKTMAEKAKLSKDELVELQNLERRMTNEGLNAIRQAKSAFGNRMTNLDVSSVMKGQATTDNSAKAILEWAENGLLANHANKTLADQYNAWRGQNKGGSGWEFINGPYKQAVNDYANMFSRLDKRRLGAQ
jgi:hypothetical protein